MIEDIDVFGADNVANLIQSGYSRYLIYRVSSGKNAYPVTSYDDVNATPAKAKQSFLYWSKNANPNVVYEITIYTDRQPDENDTKADANKPANRFTSVSKFTFVINSDFQNLGSNKNDLAPVHLPQIDINAQIEQAIKSARAEWEKDQLQKQVKELSERLDEMENIGSIEPENDPYEKILGLVSPLIESYFMPKVAAISGDNSLVYLRSVLPEIDLLLSKLAKLHKDQPDQFNILITNLKAIIQNVG